MEMTKDDESKTASLHDVRNLEAIMFSGFEMCFAMLEQLLAAQGKTPSLQLTDAQRDTFEHFMDEARARHFHSTDI